MQYQVEINSSEKIRTFLALPIDEIYYHPMTDLQMNLIEDLERLPHSVHWTKDNQLHLTLFFLGYQTRQQINLLIAELTKKNHQFQDDIYFRADQVQLFPTIKPKVIALTGDRSRGLEHLRHNINHCLQKTSIVPDLSYETQGFLPHITLGKLEKPTDLKNQPFEIEIKFSRVILYKSENTDFRSVKNTPLGTWKLTPA